MRTRYLQIEAQPTRDGSLVRELMHPARHGNVNQSLAEALLEPGQVTLLHRHDQCEELYHVTEGEGRMTLGGERFDIAVGDTVVIPPGTPHRVKNTGDGPLRILCCCAPPYSHGDTEILEEGGA